MLTEECRQKILDLLEQQKVMKSQDLVDLLNTLESVVRRSLQKLENSGPLERIHGGTKEEQLLNFEQNMSGKSFKNIHEKQQIVKSAAETINDENVICLGAGSTTLEVIPFLQGKQITIVTNSAQHAVNLVDLELATIILGETVKLATNAVLGSDAIEQLKNFHFNGAFMGTNGAHLEQGFTTLDPEEVAIRRLATENSEETFILIDHTKSSQLSFTSVIPLETAMIITECRSLESVNESRGKAVIKEATQ